MRKVKLIPLFQLVVIFLTFIFIAAGCGCGDNDKDTTPPDTLINSGPSDPTNQTSATFEFTSTEAGSTFECQMVWEQHRRGYSSCTSPMTYGGLLDGPHILEVRATDGAENTDQTPASYTWTIDTTPPDGLVASPAGGNYCATTVTLTASDGTIYYTLNGSGSTTGSSVYTGPIDISEDTTLKFIAVDSCGNQATTVTEVYDIYTTFPGNLAASPPGGSYCSPGVSVTLSCDDPGATIYYTTDGSGPNTGSPVYTGPIGIIMDTMLKFMAVEGVCGNQSGTVTEVYTIDTTSPANLTASPPGGSYCPTSVTLSCDDPGATIYYTTDGGGPNTGSPVYTIPIDIGVDTTLNFMAVDSCGNQADTMTEPYDIDTEAPTVSIISPTDGAYLNDTTVVVSGMADDGTGSGISAVLVNGYTASGTDSWSITLNSDQYADPIEVGSRGTIGITYDVFVSGDYAYVADLGSGLAIIDVSDPENPGTTVYRDTTGRSEDVYVTGGYAYVADWLGDLKIIDVSDPANPGTPIYRDISGQSYGVYVAGGYAYVANGLNGLAIIDVSDPENPGTPVYRDTSGDNWDVYVTGGYAYVADYSSGLAVIDVSDPENPGTPVYRDTSGLSFGVYVTGGYAYVADTASGLWVIDVFSFNFPVFSAVAVDNCGNVSSTITVSVTIDPVAP